MSIHQIKQIKIGVLIRPNRPNYGFCPDQTDQNWILTGPSRPKHGCNQAQKWLITRQSRPKYGY